MLRPQLPGMLAARPSPRAVQALRGQPCACGPPAVAGRGAAARARRRGAVAGTLPGPRARARARACRKERKVGEMVSGYLTGSRTMWWMSE